MAEARVAVNNDDLVTVRDAGRNLGRMVASLDSGETDQFILTKHGKMVAAVVPIAALEDLQALNRTGPTYAA